MKEIKSKLIIACLVVTAGVFCLIAGSAFMDRSKTQPAQNSTASRIATSGNSSNRPLTDEDRAAKARYRYERLGTELDLDERVVQGDERMEYFRKLLRSKDTARILAFMREQRITAGDPLHFGITAIMYSSFYNDANTTEELIYHGADINRTDDFSHSALSYAIENNSTAAAEVLLKHGASFSSVKYVRPWLTDPGYGDSYLVVTSDAQVKTYSITPKSEGTSAVSDPLYYAVAGGFLQMTELMLSSGVRPEITAWTDDHCIAFTLKHRKDERQPNCSIYQMLPQRYDASMLNLLLKYDLAGLPGDERIRKKYDDCRKDLDTLRKYKKIYLEHMDDYCYDEIILDWSWLDSFNYDIVRFIMTERSKDWEKGAIGFNRGSLPDLNRCGSVTPNTALLGIYDTLIKRYSALCGDELNGASGFDLDKFFRYSHLKGLEFDLKIEYEGKVIRVEEYDKILRRDASKQLGQARSKAADTASANE
nr:ankyrin repeat domain-containing protein [uncultured Campylobacter sp.]